MSSNQSILANYATARQTQAKALMDLTLQLCTAKETLLALTVGAASASEMSDQQALVDSLTTQVSSAKTSLKNLNQQKKAAVSQILAANSLQLVTATASANPQLYVGPTGPLGPTGPACTVTVDSTPSSTGTSHAVTSGGFYSALSQATSSSGGIAVGTTLPTVASTGQLWTNGTNLYLYTSKGTWVQALTTN